MNEHSYYGGLSNNLHGDIKAERAWRQPREIASLTARKANTLTCPKNIEWVGSPAQSGTGTPRTSTRLLGIWASA